MNTKARQATHTLEILEAVANETELSQRLLARRLGVALGLANSYLKRCIRKGWVKMRHAPGNRYFYYLTPRGVAEKSRLTARYLSLSLSFYRKAGLSCLRAFDECRARGWQRMGLVGSSELAEIALIRAGEKGIEIGGLVDYRQDTGAVRVNTKICSSPDRLHACDGWMVTDLEDPIATWKLICKDADIDRVIVPDIIDWRSYLPQPEAGR